MLCCKLIYLARFREKASIVRSTFYVHEIQQGFWPLSDAARFDEVGKQVDTQNVFQAVLPQLWMR